MDLYAAHAGDDVRLPFCFRYSSDQRVQTRTKWLLDNWQHLFTFLEHVGVQPTNNSAERAIRPAVQWRKICFGSQSLIGEEFTGRMLSVVRTCQLHDVNAPSFSPNLSELLFRPNNTYLPCQIRC